LPAFAISDNESRRAAVRDIVQAIKYMDLEQRQTICDELARAAKVDLPSDLMMTSEQVVTMASKGMSIGGHTVRHPILQRIDDSAARDEIVANRLALGAILGEPPDTFAYPNGKPRKDYTATHARFAREAGYVAAVSTAVGVCDRSADVFQIPRFVINEVTYSTILLRLLRMSSVLTKDYSC
jgi:peptidoglycan/xylan/chitin deacetylase (PgdA/CDA1 family)